MISFVSDFDTVRFEGSASRNPLAYRWNDPDKLALRSPLKDHLRLAVAYWHSRPMNGSDPFGAQHGTCSGCQPRNLIARTVNRAHAYSTLR